MSIDVRQVCSHFCFSSLIFASRVSAGAGPGEIADALDTVFLAAAPVAALALVVVLFLKEKPLRGPSAKAATA